MKKILILALLAFLAIATLVSAQMERTHTFQLREQQTYKYDNMTYKVQLVKPYTGNPIKATIRVNENDREVQGNTPAYYQDLKVSLVEVHTYNATLKMEWSKESEAPDANFYAPQNQKKTVKVNGRAFVVVYKGYVSQSSQAKIDINGEEILIREKETVTLEDGSRIKLEFIAQGSIEQIKLSLYASETGGIVLEEDVWDGLERAAEQEQKTFQAKGVLIDVKVEDITDQKKVFLTLNKEKVNLSDGETKSLKNGLEVRVSQVTLANPRTVLISVKVPDSMQGAGYEIYKKTLGENQKDETEVGSKTIRTRVVKINPENITIEVNGETAAIREGEEHKFPNANVRVSVINWREFSPKVVLDFEVPLGKDTPTPQPAPEPEPAPKPEEKPVEPDENAQYQQPQTTQTPEETVPQVQPEPEPEEAEEQPEVPVNETEEPESLGNTMQILIKQIGKFFTWLIS